jgi:hypothetical protein
MDDVVACVGGGGVVRLSSGVAVLWALERLLVNVAGWESWVATRGSRGSRADFFVVTRMLSSIELGSPNGC